MRAINKNGYGSVWIDGEAKTASRVAWQLTFGEIQPLAEKYHGIVVMHKCDNRLCCNPNHLSLGTQADNNRDRDEKGRVKSRRVGEHNHASTLRESDVREISRLLQAGLSLAQVAKQIGCSKSAVAHIKSKRLWSHLADTPLGEAAIARVKGGL